MAGWLATRWVLQKFALVCDCGILVRYKLSGYLAGSHTFTLIVFSNFIPIVPSWQNQEQTIPPKVSFSAKFLN